MRGCAGLLCDVLGCALLDWTGLDCAVLCWAVLGWCGVAATRYLCPYAFLRPGVSEPSLASTRIAPAASRNW